MLRYEPYENYTEDEVLKASSGSVFCKNLGIYFPKLYKVTHTLTKKEYQEYVPDDNDKITFPIVRTFYNLLLEQDPDEEEPGTIESKEISKIQRGEDQNESLIIRYHSNLESANTYLENWWDCARATGKLLNSISGVYSTEDGLFTFMPIPRYSISDDPLIFYLAKTSLQSGKNSSWARIVNPDGLALDPSDFGF